MKLVPIEEIADQYGIQRKTIVQAGRRHEAVAQAIHGKGRGVQVDADAFAAWWNEERDERMDKVRRGLS